MEYLGALAPIAFVFALSAVSEATKLRKEVAELRARVQALAMGQTSGDRDSS